MEPRVFNRLCAIAHEVAGIHLRAGKEPLVAARLARRLRALGLHNERDYLRYLESDESGDELTNFLDAISTNFTSFFREEDHFLFLGEWLRATPDLTRGEMRLWSAAASTGEEPYSLALVLLDSLQPNNTEFRILATDISTVALTKAVAGVYDEKAMQSVPRPLRVKHFERHGTICPGSYTVKPQVKNHIVFRRLNLSSPPFPMKGPFHAVFCRNVMIYFGRMTRQSLVSEIERLLIPGGYLFIGHSETLTGIRTALRLVKPSIYQKKGQLRPTGHAGELR
jgi:chemotaxis protein methyltransferase CheR